jgi:DNA-binding response OmpR family regulator
MGKPTVLLIEDDEAIRELVTFHLTRSGIEVIEAADATAGWHALGGADAVVLDWMLPDLSGIEWLRQLRSGRWRALPVLMLTARASEVDRVDGLDAGADDYLVKPFSAAELVARVRALLRRTRPSPRLSVGSMSIDLDAARASVAGEEVPLTRREFALLAFLAGHAGRVFSRTELLDRVWGEDFIGTERTVDQHVAQLRARVGAGRIETVRGRGYRLVDA